MTIRISPSFFQDILPPNWRAISAHTTTTKTKLTYILSPEGKRFSTLEAVNTYLTNLIQEKEVQMREGTMNKVDISFLMTEERRIGVTRRKKLMSDRNPLKNILKKTLKKNYTNKKHLARQQKKFKHRQQPLTIYHK